MLLSSVTFAQPPVSWMHNYAGVSTTVADSASYLVTGSDGRIYITGASQAGIQTVAYGPAGNVLWTQISPEITLWIVAEFPVES
ncbi:MAG: hypothetical protein IPJ66_17290 [Bacteroidetes bacterium]|nr:hypothetical protein [Bacteroidota bacterium]